MAKRVSTPSLASKRLVAVWVCAVLAAITWLVFGQTLRHKFVTYDDPQYVYENAKVAAGGSLAGVSWPFTNPKAVNCNRLTAASNRVDGQHYQLTPARRRFATCLCQA